MGNISEMCVEMNKKLCGYDKYQNSRNKNEVEDENNEKEIDNSYPENTIDISVHSQQLVIQRNDNPWENYEFIENIGKGTFGIVQKVLLNSTHDYRAMKIIPKKHLRKEIDHSIIIDEIRILKGLDHPNIMKLYEFYEDAKNFYLISEFCDQGDLLQKMRKLKSLSEVVVQFLMSKILNAVSYLHQKNILHGDIKMENILLNTTTRKIKKRFTTLSLNSTEESYKKSFSQSYTNKNVDSQTKNYVEGLSNYEIKLIDFGCSKFFSKKYQKLSGLIGTSIYCSPEVIDNKYDEKNDEWACGVLMYLLLCGEPPFQGKTESEIFERIKKGKFNFNHPNFRRVSNNCKDLICRLLRYFPNNRISASEALTHSFFTDQFNPDKILYNNVDVSILMSLINAKEKKKFQIAILNYLTRNFIDKDEEKKLKDIFKYIDKNSNNYLKKSDIKKCLIDNKFTVSDDEINHIFLMLDFNKNGIIEYNEFLMGLCDKKKLLSNEHLKFAFNAIDNEKNGYIKWNNIHKIIFQGIEINKDLLNNYLNELKITIDEPIGFSKFCQIINNFD